MGICCFRETIREEKSSEITFQSAPQKGIPNLGNTCSINAALQMIRQMSFMSQTFLDQNQSELAKTLRKFFCTQKQNPSYKSQLEEIIRLLSNHEGFIIGDAFLVYSRILQYISEEIGREKASFVTSKSKLNDVEKQSMTITIEGVSCPNCKKFLMDSDEDDYFYLEEKNNCLDIQHYSQVFNEQQSYKQSSNPLQQELTPVYCVSCPTTRLQRNSFIQYFPQYLIMKFTDPTISSSNNTSNMNPQRNYELKVHSESEDRLITYKLKGYCTYQNYHYTYTGQYNSGWFLFDDSEVTKINSLNLENTSFLLFQQCQQS